jgi:cation/acetate symporter
MGAPASEGSPGSQPESALWWAAVTATLATACLGLLASVLGADDMTVGRSVGMFVILTICGVGLAAGSRRLLDHTSAGYGLGPLAAGFALAAVPGCVAVAFYPGLVYFRGFDALIVPLGIVSGGVALVSVIGPALRQANVATLPGLVRARFGKLVGLPAAIVALLAMLGLVCVLLEILVPIIARAFDVPVTTAVLSFCGLMIMLTLAGGLRSAAWTGVVAMILALTLFLGTVSAATFAILGNPVAAIAYGEALPEIEAREVALIEQGRVDFGVFTAFQKAFLSVDMHNWAALALVLAAAMAVLPSQATFLQTVRNSAHSRRAAAHGLLVLVVLFTTVPAAAALVRLELYRAVERAERVADLPDWVIRASARDGLRVEGVSLAMIATVAEALAEGTQRTRLSAVLGASDPHLERAWTALAPEVQESVVAVAGRLASARNSSGDLAALDAQRLAEAVAPSLDANEPLGLGSLTLTPDAFVLALPAAIGAPSAMQGLIAAVVMCLALAAGLALTATSGLILSRDIVGWDGRASRSEGICVAGQRFASVAVVVCAGLIVGMTDLPQEIVLVGGVSLLAAGLFPTSVLSIWWPRATAAGCLAGMMTGLALTAYYLVGTTLYPVTFYEQWSWVSSAGGEAFAEFEEAKQIWMASEGAERTQAYFELAGRATGSLWSPGLANWIGIAPAAAGLIGMIAGCVVAVLVSLLVPGQRGFRRANKVNGDDEAGVDVKRTAGEPGQAATRT